MKENIQKRILEHIESKKEVYYSFLDKLVSFDSRIVDNGTLGYENDISQYLSDYLNKMGAQVDRFEPDNLKIDKYDVFNPGHQYKDRANVCAVFKGNSQGRSILLNGHMDVVPPGNLEEWDTDPYKCNTKDGRIFGRGTSDMKGGLAAAILAIEVIKDLNIILRGDIIFEAVVDEEGGGNGTLACCDKGYKADGAIIMEPTSMKIMPTNRGAFLAEFTIKGKQTHAATKSFGVNAIEKAIKIIGALKELEFKWLLEKSHPLLSNPTINIGMIKGGEGASTVPEHCSVKFDVEFLPSELNENNINIPISTQKVKAEVEQCIATACRGDEWLCDHPATVEFYQQTQCFETDTQHPFVKSILASSTEIMPEIKLDGFPCGCDGAILSSVGNMPVIIMGPGDMRELHTTNESISEQLFYKSIAVYANIIIDWVGLE